MLAKVEGSTARDIGRDSGISGLQIVENEPLEEMLFDRNVVGTAFRRLCWRASRLFLRHLSDELSQGGVSELILLSKGIVYQLGDATAAELSLNLPANLLATSRVAVSAADAKIEVSYSSFDAGGSRLIIGDTVASGATVVAAIERYGSTHSLEHVYLVSYAGALAGARRISEYCSTRGYGLTMLFGLAAFGLGENGFDLSFLHPHTITREEYRQRARKQFDGKPVSAVGWDFGSQVLSPAKYRALCWVEAELSGLHGSTAFSLEQRPVDVDLIRHESAAYSGLEPKLFSD